MNDITDHDLAARRFQTAARDLEHIVRHIAGRYIVRGVPLTWRLLHAIEAEALADLGLASRHDEIMLSLFQRPGNLPYPETDDPVNFGSSNALPAVFAFAVSAYEEAERRAVSQSMTMQKATSSRARRGRAWGG